MVIKKLARGILTLMLMFQASDGFSGTRAPASPTDPVIESYQPFAGEQPGVKYFPDEVERRIGEALIEGYLGNGDAILSHYSFLLDKDKTLKKAKQPITGLADNVLDLANSQIRPRDQYLKAQEEALGASPEPELEKLIRYRIKDDEFNKAQSIGKGDKIDKSAKVINNFLRPMNLASWGMGFFVPAAIDTAVNTAFYLNDLSEISLREKMALAEYRIFLEKYPDSKLRDKARNKLVELSEKSKDYQYKRAIALGEKELKDGSYNRALFYFTQAINIKPDSKEAAAKLADVNQQTKENQEELALSLEVKPGSIPKDGAYQELLEALFLEQPQALLARTNSILRQNPSMPSKDQIKYLQAKLQEGLGEYGGARKTLEEVEDRYPNRVSGERARLALSSPPYNLKKEINKAQRKHRQKSLKYALFGERFAEDNLTLGASDLVLEGTEALTTLGIFNLAAVGFRMGNLAFSNPISNQDIIERGEALLAQYPSNASPPKQVHKILAEAYEEEGNFTKALEHYALAGEMTKKERAEYREKIAKRVFARAQEEKDPASKRSYLISLMRDYPETKIASNASQDLAKLIKEEGILNIPKAQLKDNPTFFGANGISIKTELLDGNIANKELGDKGITFLAEDRIRLSFISPDGEEEKAYTVDKKVYQRLEMLLQQAQYQEALTKEGDRKKEKGKQWAYGVGGDLSVKALNLEGRLDMPQNTALFLGGTSRNPYAGLQFPLPLVDHLLPLDFAINIKPSGVTLDPAIRAPGLDKEDRYLYQE